jgi:hypothetical protein
MFQKKSNSQPSDSETISQQAIVGSLSICAVPNPSSWHDTQSKSARWLNLSFGGAEWEALFHDVLNVPRVEHELQVEGQNSEEKWKAIEIERRLRFQQAIPDYPMLGRIHSLYDDVVYKRDEIKQLRAECIKVRNSTKNPLALKGLRTLTLACNKAMKLKMGLFFASD